MFKRLNQTIINAIHKVFDESICDFSKWWQGDFETEYGYDTEEELKSFPRDDIECVIYDWIAYVLNDFVYYTLEELGISIDIKTNSHTILVEEITEFVKEELFKKIEVEWN